MKNLFCLVPVVIFLFPIGLYGAVEEPTTPPVSDWSTPEPTPDAEPQLKPMKFRDGLSIRQRRDMGLTIRNIRRVIAKGQESGEITEDMTKAELSVYVANELLQDNPGAFQDPNLDWDALLEFIEKLLPLIMSIISMFSDLGIDIDWVALDGLFWETTQSYLFWRIAV